MTIHSKTYTVECNVQGFQKSINPQIIRFDSGGDLQILQEGSVGPAGISTTAADLLDLSYAIFQIERLLHGRGGINRPAHFTLKIKLRNPNIWDDHVVECLEKILHFLGNASWEIQIQPGLEVAIPEVELEADRSIKQVALFSGGMDSTLGAVTMAYQPEQTQLVSFYRTHQKRTQVTIASELGFLPPSQWTYRWNGKMRQGGTFYYRSFLFLSLAAVVASSWNIETIYQFENGILATALPPGPSWMMTKHAHPELHRLSEELFSGLFGGPWHIINPFLTLTKRGCYLEAERLLGQERLIPLIKKTETCWYQWSNRIVGGKKEPGKPCGICVPCIVRRTAFADGDYAFDLIHDDSLREHPLYSTAFQSYFDFCLKILQARDQYDFYQKIPGEFELVDLVPSLELRQFYQLFHIFAKEFMSTYNVELL